MSLALSRNLVVGVAPEVTEGTYVAPNASQAIQVVDFPTFTPEIENLDRNLIKGSIGRLKPLRGIHSGSVELNVELRAAGATAGVSDQPEVHDLLRSAFGTFTNHANSTTVGGSTATLIELGTGQGAIWAKGDILMILGEVRFVRSVTGDQLTLNRALTAGAPAAATSVKAGWTYKPATSGHLPLSITGFFSGSANAWEQRMTGCRCSNLGLADFATGQIPKLNMTFDVLDHTSVAGSALANPVYEDQVPPVALGGQVYKDTTSFDINALEMTLAQVVTPETAINAVGGRRALRITDRNATGTFDPFLDDSDVSRFTDWLNNTDFEIQAALGVLSGGLMVQGSAVGMWMPQVNYTSLGLADQDGLVKHDLGFAAHESVALNDECYLGFV